MNYSRFLNAVSLARRPSPIRELTEILQRSPPTMISLASGMPNTEMFPFQEATFKLMDGTSLTVDKTLMKKALQYSATQGLPDLIEWLKKLQVAEHNPPTYNCHGEDKEMDLLVTTGSQDGLCKTFEMLINPGDSILMESPTYPGTLAVVKPLGCNILDVDSDGDGMKPGHLREILSRWNPSDVSKPREEVPDIPRILCLIPNGGNPTGAGLTMERRKEIYEIARKYNLLIIEDDPYYYLQFSKPRLPSLLSLDEDGRVIRSDSFSKILSSGLRLGFITGPKKLLERVKLHMQASILHTSSLSQILAIKLLDQWGLDGFRNHVDEVSQFYLERRNILLAAAEKWLTGLAEWNNPRGGMFLWMKLLGIDDTYKMIKERAMEKEVLFVPGRDFFSDSTKKSSYVRAAFSLSTPEQMDEGMRRLAELIKDELQAEKDG
ncbi:kynurenine/alpha-aminoadipate aminotransferase, mitochondrial-like isoform X2 [Ptychodera flava]|uniref:kynurenine/alpha-aminoadipate aminotransferase, mitochondrial-like isoform X2 n=2 Tax=Ptychodera flava TaxID=63121 RepID=UPI00396A635A